MDAAFEGVAVPRRFAEGRRVGVGADRERAVVQVGHVLRRCHEVERARDDGGALPEVGAVGVGLAPARGRARREGRSCAEVPDVPRGRREREARRGLVPRRVVLGQPP